ncbi:SRPBCC family protein [Niabella beijingensis]|uniref:SRPBCC family protein n=1 Tax=Niabella beijingensis TaxID=2872700 RepID=UPI001CBEFF78|nr:SRPBCC family protein [Niabella beijingensis]MBZ4189604.1 SRPBCC family protein [Niabella beijingensis]
MPVIELETIIHAAAETCFDLSRSIDLHSLSTAQTNEKAVGGRTSGLIGAGETVTWQATHFGVRQKLTSKITAYNRPVHFRDEQLQGAFRFIKHDHYFHKVENGTLMKDVFCFQSPLGMLGRLVDAVIMKRYLTRFLTERNKVIKVVAESAMGMHVLNAEQKLEVLECAGVFSYTNQGFLLQEKYLRSYYYWSDIETIFAYKRDLITTDEICLDLFTKNGSCITVEESYPGWERFLKKMSDRFLFTPEDWEQKLMQSSFQTNLTLLFDRTGRSMEAAIAVYDT